MRLADLIVCFWTIIIGSRFSLMAVNLRDHILCDSLDSEVFDRMWYTLAARFLCRNPRSSPYFVLRPEPITCPGSPSGCIANTPAVLHTAYCFGILEAKSTYRTTDGTSCGL